MIRTEHVTDRFKRAHHRLVARAIRRDPTLVEQARTVVRQRPDEPRWVRDWREVLSLPIEEIHREITRPTERMRWLRIDSPFALLPGTILPDPVRRRLWAKIRHTAP